MRLPNKNLLQRYHGRPCEWCLSNYGTVAHHAFSKGAGRLDCSFVLVALCFDCHQSHHQGNEPTRSALLALLAARNGCLQSDVETAVWCLRALPKDGFMLGVRKRQMSQAAKRLVREAIDEWKRSRDGGVECGRSDTHDTPADRNQGRRDNRLPRRTAGPGPKRGLAGGSAEEAGGRRVSF